MGPPPLLELEAPALEAGPSTALLERVAGALAVLVLGARVLQARAAPQQVAVVLQATALCMLQTVAAGVLQED